MKIKKIGKVITPNNVNDWWVSHAMAPSAVLINDEIIRVFLGCWDRNGISRIGHVDVSANNPLNIISISKKPDLDIGIDGSFDENGVFPAHVNINNNNLYLHYTGFQLGQKIRHYNFGGIAISDIKDFKFERFSKAPVLDRSDEGLFVRAGSSTIFNGRNFSTVYSAGSGWENIGGKLRPKYNIFYQETEDGIRLRRSGIKIIECNNKIEHGLGRPQIIKIENQYYIFYTRRLKSFRYFFGVAKSKNLKDWIRIDDEIEGISHPDLGFDSMMIYFPSVVNTKYGLYLFYSGNNFGAGGMGVAKIESL